MAESHSKSEVKKSPKKIILIVAGILFVIGAAGGGYFLATKLAHNEGGTDHKAAESKHEEVVEPDVYYALPSPLIVDFPAGSGAKVIKVSLTILVQGEANVAVLKKHEPMIRNNLLMAISSIGAEKAKTTEGKQELRALMLTEIGKVLEMMAGKNTVKDVYFTEFVMQ
ncbi:MAG: flagellar basal body-associated FliL family protein [Methylomonas sp.]